VLSFKNISRGRKSTKPQNAGSRWSFNRAPSVAGNNNESFSEKKRLTLSYPSQSSIEVSSNDDLQLFRSLVTGSSKELKLDCKKSDSSDEVFETPASNGQDDKDIDYDSFSDSDISDWQDQFSYSDSNSGFNAAKSCSWSTDSCSYSLGSKGSHSTIRMLKPMDKRSLKLNDLPSAGMLFVGWLNKTGNRFKTFQLEAKLQTVIDWLGTPLPIVIQEPGRGGRRCDSDLTLAGALGKMLRSPTQQGIAFFVGPVNGKLSYLMTMVDLSQLCDLKASEDEKLEKLKSWI